MNPHSTDVGVWNCDDWISGVTRLVVEETLVLLEQVELGVPKFRVLSGVLLILFIPSAYRLLGVRKPWSRRLPDVDPVTRFLSGVALESYFISLWDGARFDG